jgi:hypothetical protein
MLNFISWDFGHEKRSIQNIMSVETGCKSPPITCQDDFGKYSRKLKHRYLDKIYNAVPKMVGRKFVYAHVYGKVPGAAWNKNSPGAL